MKITITDLEVSFCVGVPEAERAQPQRLLLTVELDYDFSSAAASDDIAATIDYFAVAQTIRAFGIGRQWKLIEKLASDVAGLVLANYPATAVSITVKKFPIPNTAHVAVSLTKRR
jgi:dihydroneopterin aldolase